MSRIFTNKLTNKPVDCIIWHDSEPTGATGWIVVDKLISKVGSGGLFMHANATEKEVADLAAMMTLKNSLQDPLIGGIKGGIRYDHKHPDAKQILRRFLIDNKHAIANYWSTGADLNTDNNFINKVIVDDLGLTSVFHSLANMLEQQYGYPNQAKKMLNYINLPISEYFTLGRAATGYSILTCIQKLCPDRPSIIIQGFGAVGSSFAYYVEKLNAGKIVGVVEKDYFVFGNANANFFPLIHNYQHDLAELANQANKLNLNFIKRDPQLSDEEFLIRCLLLQQADIFSPCAMRYAITEAVANTLWQKTFAMAETPWIIAGANKVFAGDAILNLLSKNGVNILPEWISNSGNTLLYNETLKYSGNTFDMPKQVLGIIAKRIDDFLNQSLEHCQHDIKKLYQSSSFLAQMKVKKMLANKN